MQEMCERIVKFEPQFRQRFSQDLLALGDSPGDIQDLFQALERGDFEVSPPRGLVLLQTIKQIPNLALELSKMRWIFGHLDEEDPDLIIGDHAVMLTDIGPESEPLRPLAIRNPHIEVLIPLSRRMAAIAHWDGKIAYARFARGMAARFNERTCRYAHQFVFASHESDELLAQAISLRGSGPRVHVQRIQLGKALIIRTDYR
jgi:hypothetical protein